MTEDMGGKDEERAAPPFGGKLDAAVAKVVPARFTATAFVGASAAALIFLVLTIIGFARSPEEATAAQRDAIQKKYEEERAKHAETQKALKDATSAKKDLERKLEQLDSQLKKAATDKSSAEAAQKKAESALAEERTKHAETQKALRDAQKAKKDAEDKAAAVDALLTRARSEKEAADAARKNLEAQLADLRKQLAELQKQKAEQAKIEENAQAVFDGIVKTVSEIDDPAKKLETMERLRASSYKDLAGTAYLARLDATIAYEKKRLEDQKAALEKKMLKDAKSTFADAMRKASAAPDHSSAIAILKDAKEKLAGTVQELAIEKEIQRREASNREAIAKAAYEDIVARTKKAPTAYDENIAAAEAALPKTEGTAYKARLESQLAELRAGQKEYIARTAYEEVMARCKNAPTAYDENIAAAEAALPRTEGTAYKARLESQLKQLRQQRLEAIGRAALEEAKSQLAKSPKDYAANVAVLKELKAKAAGSPYEATIDALLKKQEALAARAK